MLALFKTAAAQFIASSSDANEEEDYSGWDAETTVTLNVGELRQLVPALPSWSGVADACSRAATPVYHAVKRTFTDDLDQLVHLLADLEPMSLDDYEFEESITTTAIEESVHHAGLDAPTASSARIPYCPPTFRKRRKTDPELDGVLFIPSSDPSIPSIVVTPCPDMPHDRSCLVPYQDASFGNRLAVPMHPVVNGVHPPLQPGPIPYVDHWHFKDGHWWAILPTLDEQMKRNMFSRPIPRRRRAHSESPTRTIRARHSRSH